MLIALSVKVDVGVKVSPKTVFAPPVWLGNPWNVPPATDGVAIDVYVGVAGHAEILAVVEYVPPTKLALADAVRTKSAVIAQQTRSIDIRFSTMLQRNSLRLFNLKSSPYSRRINQSLPRITAKTWRRPQLVRTP